MSTLTVELLNSLNACSDDIEFCNMTKEHLFGIFFTETVARSPYKLYGCPSMWKILTVGNKTLFARPGRTMTRLNSFEPYVEVDGVHYQWQKDGEWYDQGCQDTFDGFLKRIEQYEKHI